MKFSEESQLVEIFNTILSQVDWKLSKQKQDSQFLNLDYEIWREL